MQPEDVRAVFWSQIEGAAYKLDGGGKEANLPALQAFALAYLASSMDELRLCLEGIVERLDSLKGI